MSHPIVDEELSLLESVATLLAEVPFEAPPSEADIVRDLVRLRDELPQAKAEDRGALMDQYNAQLALLEQLRESRQRPQVDPDCPYFAHLKLKEEGRERDLCLGKATRIQRGVRIVDWRNAPISRLFYQYQQGEEYEEEMGGRVLVGEVVARRTVTIAKGSLIRIDAPEGIFAQEEGGWSREARPRPRLAGGQGAALRAHGVGQGRNRRLGTDMGGRSARVDKRLPDIAGLIDQEQFGLITRPTSGFVVIRGTAGSGKTTVALHRIAWLAYGDHRIDSGATLVLVFSQALRDYVGHVLPALGVHRVQIKTFREWAAGQRRRHFPKLPRRIREDTPSVVVKLKLHPVILIALQEQRKRARGPRTPEQAIDDWSSVLMDRELLRSLFAEHAPKAFTDDDLTRATNWCRDRHNELLEWQEGPARTRSGSDDVVAEMDVEDDALLLYAWQLRVGPLRGKRSKRLVYRHLMIDEVQDFSPIEVRVLLGCLDEKRSLTLAGDTQQHVMTDAGFTSWADFFRHLGVEGTEVNTLRISYRCSQQIMGFAINLLGYLREDSSPPMTTRTGPEVELFRFTDHGACVAFLADALTDLTRSEPRASVVLLTASRTASSIYMRGLERAEVPRLRRVTQQDFTFSPGIEITEIDQVKGLEFDYVILLECSAQNYRDTSSARRLLHVGATRAIHQLWLTSVATPSPVVREAIE